MKPSEVLSIVVRTLGLLLVLTSLATHFYALADLALGRLGIGVIVCMNFGVPSLVVGLWLLVGFGLLDPSTAKRPRRRGASRRDACGPCGMPSRGLSRGSACGRR